MPGSAFQRETWELSQVIHLPDSVLAITEQGGGEQAEGRETSLDGNHHRRKLNASGLLARRVSGCWGPTWAPPSPAVKDLGRFRSCLPCGPVTPFPYLFRHGLM